MNSTLCNAACMLLLCCLSLSTTTLAAAGEKKQGLFRLSAQYVHSSGSYGLDRDTTIDSGAVVLDYFRGPWFGRVTIPYVRISGFGIVTLGVSGPLQISQTMEEGMRGTPGNGMPDNNGPGQDNGDGRGNGRREREGSGNRAALASASVTESSISETTESGLGDIVLEAGYGFYPFYPNRLLMEARALVKLPSADEDEGLGTGETDVGFQVEFKQPVGYFTPFLGVGYILTGDPDDIDYNNTWNTSVGTIYSFNRKVNVTAAYNYRSEATDLADDFQEVSLEIDWLVHRNWNVAFLGAAGFSDAAPDWTLGLTAGMTF